MKNVLRALLPLRFAICADAAPPDPSIVNSDDMPWAEGFAEGVTIKRFPGELARMLP